MSVFFGIIGKNGVPIEPEKIKEVAKKLGNRFAHNQIYFLNQDYELHNTELSRWIDNPGFSEKPKGFFIYAASKTELEFNSLSPGISQDKSIQAVIDGEIYEYQHKQPKLTNSCTNRFFSERFLEKGEDCFGNFNAMYAGIIVDKKKKEIILARDKHGMKSLFYSDQSDYLFFSNALRHFSCSSLFNKSINWDGIWNNLSFPAPPQPLTDLKDCHAILRGHILKVQFNGEISKKEYWSIPVGTQEKNWSLRESAEAIDHAIEKSVRLRTKGQAEVGAPVSGGVDSPYLAAHASSFLPDMKTFTFCLKGEAFQDMNEDAKAKLVAEKYGLRHFTHHFSLDELRNDFNEMVEVYDQVGANLFATYFQIVKKMKEQGVNVLLSGLAADESHGGFHYFKYIPLWNLIRKFPFVTYPIPRGLSPRLEDLKNLSSAKTIDEYYSHAFSAIKEAEKRKILPSMNFNSYQTIRDCYLKPSIKFEDDVEGLLYFMFANVPNHHLYRFDQFSSYFGVKTRYPFLDDDVVDIAFKVPSRYKVKGDVRKIALKEAARPYLPEELLAKQKKGLTLPIGRWINHSMKNIKEKNLEQLKSRDEFNPAGIDYLVEKYSSVKPGKVVKLVMLEIWMKNNGF